MLILSFFEDFPNYFVVNIHKTSRFNCLPSTTDDVGDY